MKKLMLLGGSRYAHLVIEAILILDDYDIILNSYE